MKVFVYFMCAQFLMTGCSTTVKAITTKKDKIGHSCISPWQYNHVIQRS